MNPVNANSKIVNRFLLLREIFYLYDSHDRKKIILLICVQVILAGLDLVGVALIGVLASLSVAGITSGSPVGTISSLLKVLQLNEFSFQIQAAVLASAATVILILRTIGTALLTKRILHFSASRTAKISGSLLNKVMSQDLIQLRSRSVQETMFVVTQGVETLTLGIIGTATSMVADISLMLILSVGLIYVNPVLAISMLLFFSIIAWIVYRLLHQQTGLLGRRISDLTVESNNLIYTVVRAFREIYVHDKQQNFVSEIVDLRQDLATAHAINSFMPHISKYVIEIALVVGAFLMAAFQFVAEDSLKAITTLSIFLAAGSRVAPATLRVQQAALQIKSSFGQASTTLLAIEKIRGLEPAPASDNELQTEYPEFESLIEVKHLGFSFPDAEDQVIKDISLTVNPGEIVALVGPSGSGKTTLVDLMLGLIKPDSGSVRISSGSPENTIRRFPGAISYVPQEVELFPTTVRRNLAMGFDDTRVPDTHFWAALKAAQLDEFISSLPLGLDTHLSRSGINLSGGQKQRLGIARALFTNPKVLVLDESTSALDASTESQIVETILGLAGDITVIIIAHRLSSIKNLRMIYYIGNGKVLGNGNFENLKQSVPEFARQASLMGL